MKFNASARYFSIAAICLLTLSLSATAAEIGGHLDAQQVGTRGKTLTQGPLVAFLRDNPLANGHSPAEYSVAATSFRVETYSQDYNTYPVGVHQSTHEGNETYQASTLTGLENFGRYHYDVLPTTPGSATATLTSNCTTIAPSQVASVEVDSQISKPSPDNHITVDTTHAMTWQGCNEAAASSNLESIQVQGEFVIVAYSWNQTMITSDGVDAPIPSGPGMCPNDPNGVAYSVGVLSCDHQRYFYVHQGTLTMALGADTPYQAFLGGGTHVQSGQDMSFQDASGHVAGLQLPDVRARLLTLSGAVDATIADGARSAPLSAHVEGQAQGAQADGTTLALITTSPPGLQLAWVTAAIGIALALLVLAPVGQRARSVIRRQRARSELAPALGLLRRDSADEILARANRALALDPNFGLAYSVRAFAVQRRDPAAALADYQLAARFLPAGGDRDKALQRARDLAFQLGGPDPRRL